MRSMGTGERPTEVTEDTNKKSLFAVSKTPDIHCALWCHVYDVVDISKTVCTIFAYCGKVSHYRGSGQLAHINIKCSNSAVIKL